MKISIFLVYFLLILLCSKTYSYNSLENLVEISIYAKDISKIYYIKFSEKNNKNSFEIYDVSD